MSLSDTILNYFSSQKIDLNFLDIIIILTLLFYAFEGYAVGFIVAFFDLLSFIFSFVFGLKFYSLMGSFLVGIFSIPLGFANAIGFFITALIAEMVLNFILRKTLIRLQIKLKRKDPNSEEPSIFYAYLKAFNQFAGVLPGVFSALILFSFLLTVIISLPFSPVLKHVIYSSKLGNLLVVNAQGFEKKINAVFGGAVNETLNFLTVDPQSSEFVKLNFKATDLSLDEVSEREMLAMVNEERKKNNLLPLILDANLQKLARLYAEDMFNKSYFSHESPEGTSPFDRMTKADISYISAGENLALAPNVSLAMQGLMDSPGHKANILSTNFAKIGIGVINGGIYGKMFVQEFTN